MAHATLLTNFERKIPLTHKKLNEVIILSHKEIVQLLPLFKEECVYMREAYLENGILHCSFNSFDYPFSKEPTKHFTRTHALLFVTQASYLNTAILQKQNPKWPLDRTKAISLALEEQMTFTNIQLNFRHFIRNRDGVDLNLTFENWRIINNRIHLEIKFEFPKGCNGWCRALIVLDGTLIVPKV